MNILFFYLIFVNLAAFLLMGADKSRARRHLWRIPESCLFGAALLGGSLGAWAGMYCFRHKTKHTRFVLGLPLLLAVQLMAVWFVARIF